MDIIDFYYDDSEQLLEVTFTTDINEDLYRNLKLSLLDIQTYYPLIIEEDDVIDCDEDFVIELLEEYFKQNPLPEEDLY